MKKATVVEQKKPEDKLAKVRKMIGLVQQTHPLRKKTSATWKGLPEMEAEAKAILTACVKNVRDNHPPIDGLAYLATLKALRQRVYRTQQSFYLCLLLPELKSDGYDIEFVDYMICKILERSNVATFGSLRIYGDAGCAIQDDFTHPKWKLFGQRIRLDILNIMIAEERKHQQRIKYAEAMQSINAVKGDTE